MSESATTTMRSDVDEAQLAFDNVPDSMLPARPAPEDRGRRLTIPDWLLGQGTWPLNVGADLFAIFIVAVATQYLTWTALTFAGFVIANVAAFGLYRSRLSMSVLDDSPRLLCSLFVAASLTVLLALGLSDTTQAASVIDGRKLLFFGVAFVAVIVSRALAYAGVRRLRSLGVAHRTLIVGAGRVGSTVARVLQDHPEYGLEPIGFIDSNPLLPNGEYSVPVLGDHASLPSVLSRHQVRTVIIAFASPREEAMIDMIRDCDRMDCEIFVIPRLFEVHHVSNDMDYVWGMPLTRLRRGAHRSAMWRLKRLFDIISSALALVVLSPVMGAVAFAVRLEGGPGVLFQQIRIGIDGREFRVLKFRSMRPVDETESATNWNISQDDRVGPVGRIIRKTSLDELPQLFNIFRGDMSVVGPRPERPHFVEEFRSVHPRYFARHRVPCGLTGWSQIHGLRGDTSIADRARLDNYYVENWSLWLDVKIILRTVSSVFTRAGS